MKKLTPILLMICLFSTAINAQENYKGLWNKVLKFENDNLPKSALEVVNEIYNKAQKDKNSPQIIKTLFYKSKISLVLEENAQLNIINQFKKHIASSSFPTKNVLENILANLYWQYFNQNRWKFYDRTQTSSKVDNDDFRTWDLTTLFNEVHSYFEASLQNTPQLQKIKIHDFEDILQLTEDTKTFQPTLFDFLAHNSLEFYKTTETNITKPAYEFKIDNPDFLGDFNKFSTLTLTSKDSLSLQLNALKVYQKLIQFHLNSKNSNALVANDIERLTFVNEHGTFYDKQKLLLITLEASKNQYKGNEASGLYAFEIAKIYNELANTYQPNKDETHQFKNKEALIICTQTINAYPKSLGAKKCTILKQQITSKSLNIQTEKNVSVEQFSKVLVNYKNVHEIYFSVYKITSDQITQLNEIYNEGKQVDFIQKLSKIESWCSDLKNEGDYQQHTTEIGLPKLPNGNFLILATTDKNLVKKSTFAFSTIQATDIAFIINHNQENNYQAVDRNTGMPLANAKVHFINTTRNHYDKKIDTHFTTDKNGEFTYYPNNREYFPNVRAIITYKGKTASFGYFYINPKYRNISSTEKTYTETFLFTDRSIYRPGQTIYFKGISMESFKNKATVKTNETVVVTLKDVNHQNIKEITLKTNDFGSFSSQFIIPNQGLTGQFVIETSIDGRKNYTYISVEEYKRPKFEAEFSPVTSSIKINDVVTINGFAKAYSGATISDAKVVYRVHRKVEYPRWWYWYKPFFISQPQEITYGETITDNSGNFSIEFKALPDESVNKKDLPVFTYEITADVTDINGETRSATSQVKVGYHTLLAELNIPENIDKSEEKTTIKINTKNLNGEFVAGSGTISIYKLKAPNRILRKRPWVAPDYQTIPQKEFEEKYPHDAYTDEDNFMNWDKENAIQTLAFNTEKQKELILNKFKNWPSGKYLAVLETSDKFGQKVEAKQFFTLFSPQDKLPADQKLISITTDKKSYKAGDKVVLTVSSNSKDISLVLLVEKQRNVVEKHYIHLTKDHKKITIPVTEQDLGGFGIQWYYVNYNAFDKGNLLIQVPYPKTDLEITTKTFRDKLYPGEQQTWSFTVKGAKKDMVTAELLAGMYDASLDAFKPHQWQFTPIQKPIYHTFNNTEANASFGISHFRVQNLYDNNNGITINSELFNAQYNWYGFSFFNSPAYIERTILYETSSAPVEEDIEEEAVAGNLMASQRKKVARLSENSDGVANSDLPPPVSGVSDTNDTASTKVQIRKNLQETAFFYPHLTTDKDGNVSFNFTAPEALTKWKLQLLAHTKELNSATKTLETVTQKELMVTPNAPRFLRQGDQITINAKIANLSDKNLEGTAQLILTNPITASEVNLLTASGKTQSFSVAKNGNTNVSWNLSIPENLEAVQYKIIAKAGDFSDGEQNALPVLSNRMLVTETLSMWVKGNQTKTFSLDKLKNNSSSTLKNHQLTLEITSNPAWYAIQALPYLMEYPHECSEQTFARYYANTLASHIANSNPRIQEVFNQWKSSDALLSNLEKNQELKSLIIQETPWLRDAQSETEQKKRIALLFDLNKLSNDQQAAIQKLKNMQMSNGGFPWFKGSYSPNPYITLHIASGFGHLKQLGITTFDSTQESIILKAIQFLDNEIVDIHQEMLKQALIIKEKEGNKKYEAFLKKNHLGNFIIQYLYMRSFYKNVPFNNNTDKAVNFYTQQTTNYWKDFDLYSEGLMALINHRTGNKKTATTILKSLKENSITSEELGMYWKANKPSWFWYQAPIETQALLIEAFAEIENDATTIDNLKIWLLKNKQVSQWKTTKATTEAIYALLLQNSDWVSSTELVTVTIGNNVIKPSENPNIKVEAGTGYFKTSWKENQITPNMGNVTLNSNSNSIAWGGLYWQYFEDLDKITAAKTPLQLSKKLFKKINSDTGKKLVAITDNSTLNVGDLLTVRIELRSDRDMEFVHMKDMRASGVEPVTVLSEYKWQDSLGYYESTQDAATNFFFDRLPQGVYVFEYDVRVNNAGNFSNGITTIQNMYAPEFSSHSEGNRLIVKK